MSGLLTRTTTSHALLSSEMQRLIVENKIHLNSAISVLVCKPLNNFTEYTRLSAVIMKKIKFIFKKC